MKQNNMTTEEVNEKFKDIKVKFTNYFKYTFTFTGTTKDGYEIQCDYGGDSDMIYRFSVSDVPINFNSVDDWSIVSVSHNKNQVYYIDNF